MVKYKCQWEKQTMDQSHQSTFMTSNNSSAHVFCGGDSGKDAYKCPRCDKTFRSKNTLNKHTYRTHKSSVMTVRNSSPIVFFSGSSAEEKKATLRSMISWNGSILSCTICGKTTDKIQEKNAKTKMEQHIESLHTEGGSYDCSKCDQTFRRKPSLHQHTYRSHN